MSGERERVCVFDMRLNRLGCVRGKNQKKPL